MAYLRMDSNATLFYSEDWLVRIRFFILQTPMLAQIERGVRIGKKWHYYPLETLTDQAAEDFRLYLLTAAHDVPSSANHIRNRQKEGTHVK